MLITDGSLVVSLVIQYGSAMYLMLTHSRKHLCTVQCTAAAAVLLGMPELLAQQRAVVAAMLARLAPMQQRLQPLHCSMTFAQCRSQMDHLLFPW